MGWTAETRKAYREKNREKLNQQAQAWRDANREKYRESCRANYYKDKERKLEKSRQWRIDNPEKKRESDRKSKGLPEPTRPMPENCECCGFTQLFPDRRLALDHDHITGEFRGWLCMKCNTGIGKLGDTVEGLEKALAYLRRRQQSDT